VSAKFVSGDSVNSLFYWLARSFVFLVQLMPLKLVALIGRVCGYLFYYIDGRHRRVAVNNLLACLCNSHSQKEIISIARENFCRIGEVYLSALKTASIPAHDIGSILSFKGEENINLAKLEDGSLPSFLFALGHFGNFELYAKTGFIVPDFDLSTTYRGFRQPWLERLILSLRARSGVSFFDRRFDGKKLRSFMNRPGTITGLLVDQHAGGRGLRLPFFGLPCSVSPSPALFALRYNLCLHCCFCRRLGLGRWEIEVGPKIGTVCGGSPRAFEDILMDINRHFEAFILEDPANWFWVHDRWKLSGRSFSTG
jgi:KDO2-lipid IV(A) lauroyltransferase